MRKVLAFLLLAGAAAPALAADPDDRPGRHRESGTQSASEDRGDRPARSERVHVERASRVGGDDGSSRSAVRLERAERGERGNDHPPAVSRVEPSVGGGDSGERRFDAGTFRGRMGDGGQDVELGSGGAEPAVQRVRREDRRSEDTVRTWRGPRVVDAPEAGGEDRGSGDSVRTWRGPRVIEAPQDVAASPTLRQQSGSLPQVFRNRVPIVSTTPREGTQPPLRTENRRSNWASWSTSHWRRDRKYDWRDHRRRHRSLFHLGFYYDPFGWSYRPYRIGWRLWPSYYSSRYWLHDPWQYRLPYAPPGYRWIRYYDDAVLVDTWNGQVVDVIYNFFW